MTAPVYSVLHSLLQIDFLSLRILFPFLASSFSLADSGGAILDSQRGPDLTFHSGHYHHLQLYTHFIAGLC